MIFQIDYKSDNRYDEFYIQNRKYYDSIDYKLFDDREIDKYLKDYGWQDAFYNVNCNPNKKSIRCDLLRLMMLYDFGGCYLDADVVFESGIVNMENDIQRQYTNMNIVQYSRCMCFIRGIKQSRFMGWWLHKYLTAEEITFDIHMNTGYEESDFPDNLVIISDTSFKKYFKHVNITTGQGQK